MGTVLPIYAVDDLDGVLPLTARDWSIAARSVGTPERQVGLVREMRGNEVALLRVDRPGAMDGAYAKPTIHIACVRPTHPASTDHNFFGSALARSTGVNPVDKPAIESAVDVSSPAWPPRPGEWK